MSNKSSYINYFNDYTEVRKSLFLGNKLGLIENLRNEFPQIWGQYKLLKSLDWDEKEIDISACRSEFNYLPKEITDLMIKTLAWQFEADSSAAHIGNLIMPFVNNTELSCYVVELMKNECLTPDHEVLTDNGWKRIDQVTVEDKVTQWDYDTHETSLVNPTSTFSKDYDGEMYHLTKKNKFSQIVTPNHRLPIIYEDTEIVDGCKIPNVKKNHTWVFTKDLQLTDDEIIPSVKGKTGLSSFIRGNELIKNVIHYSGKVYCLTVPTGFFLVRHNRTVSVTGNCLHALAYKTIVEYSFENPEIFLKELLSIEESFSRLNTVKRVFDEMYVLAHTYALDPASLDKHAVKKAIFKFWATVYALERIQFISSFAITFGLAEQGYFVPIAKLVQKICTDEFQVHVQTDKLILANEMNIEDNFSAYLDSLEDIGNIVTEIVNSELTWLDFMFGDKDEIARIRKKRIRDFVLFSATDVYRFLNIENPFGEVTENPLPYMNKWIVIDSNQSSPQEESVANYLLGGFIDDSSTVNMSKYNLSFE